MPGQQHGVVHQQDKALNCHDGDAVHLADRCSAIGPGRVVLCSGCAGSQQLIAKLRHPAPVVYNIAKLRHSAPVVYIAKLRH